MVVVQRDWVVRRVKGDVSIVLYERPRKIKKRLSQGWKIL